MVGSNPQEGLKSSGNGKFVGKYKSLPIFFHFSSLSFFQKHQNCLKKQVQSHCQVYSIYRSIIYDSSSTKEWSYFGAKPHQLTKSSQDQPEVDGGKLQVHIVMPLKTNSNKNPTEELKCCTGNTCLAQKKAVKKEKRNKKHKTCKKQITKGRYEFSHINK